MFGARVDPVLFTTPWAIAKAAVVMIGSGELWHYLWPSLVVLALGLTLAAIIGIAMGLLLARFWVLDVALGVYITFLFRRRPWRSSRSSCCGPASRPRRR